MNRNMKTLILRLCLPLAALMGLMRCELPAYAKDVLPVVAPLSFARTCTWDGGAADALASSAANWDTDVAPVAGDSIVFPTTTKACTWDISTSLAAFTVNSGYVNTITQNSGANFTFSGAFAVNGACTITCNAGATTTCGAFSMTTGTFTQGGAFVSTTFGVTGTGIYTGSAATMSTTAVTHSNTATITATSGIWSLAGSWTKNNSPTFTHNSGTIDITANSTFSPAATLNKVTISAGGGFTITISSGTTCPLGASPSTASGGGVLTIAGTATWTGLWTHTGILTVTGTLTGTSTPTLKVDRGLTTSGATITNAIGTVTLSGTTTSTYTDTSDALSGSTFVLGDGSNKSITVAASTTCRLGTTPTSNLGTGTITVTGTLTYSGLWTHTGSLTTSASSTVTGSGSPSLSLNQSLTLNSTSTWTSVNVTCTGAGNASIYTDTGAKNSGTWTLSKSGAGSYTIAASTSMNIGASPTVASPSGGTLQVNGTLQVSGTMTCVAFLAVANTGTVSGALTNINLTRSITITSGATFPSGVVLDVGTTGTMVVTAPGITLGTCTATSRTAAWSIAASTTFPLGTTPSTGGALTNGGTITYSGLWTHSNDLTVSASATVTGTSSPSLAIAGSLNISATATSWTSVNVTKNGSLTGTYTDTGAKNSGVWTISTTGATTIAASTIADLGTNPSTSVSTNVTLTINGTVTFAGNWVHVGAINTGASTVITGTSTPTLTIDNAITINATATITNAIGTITLNGTAGPTISDTADKLSGSTFVLNKSGAATTTVGANTIMRLGASPTSTVFAGGVFSISGTVNVSGTWTFTGSLTLGATGTITGAVTTISVTRDITLTAGGTMASGINLIYSPVGAQSARTWALGGRTFGTFTNNQTAVNFANLTISGSNTFTTFKDDAKLVAHTLTFTSGTTQTAAAFLLAGSSGNVLTLNASTPASAATLHRTDGLNTNAAWLSVRDITVDARPEWFAGDKSTNVSGNTNWLFIINPRLRKWGF